MRFCSGVQFAWLVTGLLTLTSSTDQSIASYTDSLISAKPDIVAFWIDFFLFASPQSKKKFVTKGMLDSINSGNLKVIFAQNCLSTSGNPPRKKITGLV